MDNHRIATVADLNAVIQNGPYAWPGGYPIYFIAADNEPLSFKSVEDNLALVVNAIHNGDDPQWRVTLATVNWEDPDLYCVHTNVRIESAYAEDDARLSTST